MRLPAFDSFCDSSLCLQRVAVSTAANICRQLPSDAADFVTDVVPLLTNLVQYQDSKVDSLIMTLFLFRS